MASVLDKIISKSVVKNLSELKEYNFDKRYVADNKGNVYLIKGDNGRNYLARQMKPYIDRLGYVEYVLTTAEGKKKHMMGHRIVAGLFLKKVKGKEYVNHKDGNRSNNDVKNLEYLTHSENVKHSYDKLRPNRLNREEIDLNEIQELIKRYYRRVEYWFYRYWAYKTKEEKAVKRDIRILNSGFCYNAALVVAKLLKTKHDISVPILYYTRAHAFINVLDKYYDSEHTLGCDHEEFYNYLVDTYNKGGLEFRLFHGEEPKKVVVTDRLEDLSYETERTVCMPSDIIEAMEWCYDDANASKARII